MLIVETHSGHKFKFYGDDAILVGMSLESAHSYQEEFAYMKLSSSIFTIAMTDLKNVKEEE